MHGRHPDSWTLYNWRKVPAYLRWRPCCPMCSHEKVNISAVEAPEAPGLVQAACEACGHVQACINRGYAVFELLTGWHRDRDEATPGEARAT